MHRYVTFKTLPVLDRRAFYGLQGLLHGGRPFFGLLMTPDAYPLLILCEIPLARGVIIMADVARVLYILDMDIIFHIQGLGVILLMALVAQIIPLRPDGDLPAGFDRIVALRAFFDHEGGMAVRAENAFVF